MNRTLHIDTGKEWRGGQKQAAYLTTGLMDSEFQPIMVAKKNSPLWEYCRNHQIETLTLPLKGEGDLYSAYQIARYCKKRNIRLITAHTAHAHTISLLVKLFKKDAILISVRRVDFPLNQNRIKIIKYKHPYIDQYIAISGKIKNVMVESGIQPQRIKIIRSAINTTRFENLPKGLIRSRENVGKEAVIIGTIAAFAGHKDYPTLIKAANIVAKKCPKAHFIALGEGRNKDSLIELRNQYGLEDKFSFLGFKKDIGPYLGDFDIFVLASKEEGLGTSLLDAQAAGKPVATTDAGGIPEAVSPNETALVSPKENPEALAVNILRLIKDKKLRDEFSVNGVKFAAKFSIENLINSYMNLYKELLTKREC